MTAPLPPRHPSGLESIAIVGMACRFPGAANRNAFWDLLRGGEEALSPLPGSRFPAALRSDDLGARGKLYLQRGGFIPDIDHFDAAAFGISPREAASLDPQQRLLLECGWQALEDAGMHPFAETSRPMGVFVGAMNPDHLLAQRLGHFPERVEPHTVTGSSTASMAGRLAYQFNFNGPALVIDTACSASLVALHLACQSLRLGECEGAVVGGVNAIFSPELLMARCRARMLSPSGHCWVFDARADGYVPGEGCGVVILKRLSDAQRDGDQIRAIIRASAVNHDGRSPGYSVPSGQAQEALIRRTLAQAGLQPDDIDCVEAHGTGTPVGDPIELKALAQVFGRQADDLLTIGSVKTNVGHLESAAGMAALFKVVLGMSHDTWPAHRNFHQPTPDIDFGALGLRLPLHAEPWPRRGPRRRAGISGFGISGTNAHVIVESPTPTPTPKHRTGQRAQPARPETVWMFSGQGGQYPGMAMRLAQTFSSFAKHVEHCLVLVENWSRGRPHAPNANRLRHLLLSEAHDEAVHQTRYTQPALFILQTGLARLWQTMAGPPDVVLGHSVGEFAAAMQAGVFDLETGLELVLERARLMHALPVAGGMLAVSAKRSEVEGWAQAAGVEIATENGPNAYCVAGAETALAAFADKAKAAGVPTQKVAVSHAFHSALMDPMLSAFGAAAERCDYQVPRCRFLSTVTADWADKSVQSAQYWRDQIRHPVRFNAVLQELPSDSVVVDIGPHHTLSRLLRAQRRAAGRSEGLIFALQERGVDPVFRLRETAHRWQAARLPGDLKPLYPADAEGFAFQRRQHGPVSGVADSLAANAASPTTLRSGPQDTMWSRQTTAETTPCLREHCLDNRAVLPGVMGLAWTHETATAAGMSRTNTVVAVGAQWQQGLALAPGQNVLETRCLAQVRAEAYEARLSGNAAGAWIENLRVTWSSASQEPRWSWTLRAPEHWQAEARESTDGATVATFNATLGLHNGRGLQVLSRVWRGGRQGGVSVLRFKAPDVMSGPPALCWRLLDGVLQALSFQVDKPKQGVTKACIPVALERLVLQPAFFALEADVLASPQTYALLRPRPNPDHAQDWNADANAPTEHMAIADAVLIAHDQPIAWLEGIRVVRMAQAPLQRYTWRAEPSTQPKAPPQHWLVVCDDEIWSQRLQNHLAAAGHLSQRVPMDATAADKTAAVRQMRERATAAQQPCGGILLADGPHGDEAQGDMAMDPTLEQAAVFAQDVGEWLAALQSTPGDGRLVGLALHGQTLPKNGVPHAPLHALWSTITHEAAACAGGVVHVTPDDATWPHALPRPKNPSEHISWLHQGEIRVARLQRRTLRKPQEPVTIAGHVLLTGGLGGLGPALVDHLLARGAEHITICSRREVGDALARWPSEKVSHRRCDVGNLSSLTKACALATAEHGPFRVVLHAAGLLRDGPLTKRSREDFSELLHVKARGAWNLDRVLGDGLQHFIVLSSMAAALGNAGQSNYAWANGWMESCIQARQRRGQPAQALQLGPVDGPGMVDTLSPVLRRRLSQRGFSILPLEHALRYIDAALAQPTGPAVWGAFAFDLKANAELQTWPAFGTSPAGPSPALSPSPSSSTSLADALKAAMAQVLGYNDPNRLELQQSLRALGIDSLLALELKHTLETLTGSTLSPTYFVEYESAAELLEALVEGAKSGTSTPTHTLSAQQATAHLNTRSAWDAKTLDALQAEILADEELN